MQTSRTLRIVDAPRISYLDRGAGSGRAEFDKTENHLTDCKTKPYMDGDLLRVPSLKRQCLRAWQGATSDTDPVNEQTVGEIVSFVRLQLGSPNVGVLNQFRKVYTDRYKTIADVPEHDPGISVSNPDPVKPETYEKFSTDDPIERFFAGINSAFGFITNPMNWLAIMSLLLGFAILALALWKGLV